MGVWRQPGWLVVLQLIMLSRLCLVICVYGCVAGVMVMDESSCVEVEEEECGFCHTIYMEECKMKMMPAKVSVCKNVTIYKDNCKTRMEEKIVEEERPICEIKMINKKNTSCQENTCTPVIKCKIGMKKMKKKYPMTECEKEGIGEEEKCVEMVKLKKEKHKAKHCSFHPKTMCNPAEGSECKIVKKRMCEYVDNQ